MRRELDLRSERGTTLAELLVATSAGIVVMATLSLLIIVVLHGTARVDARIEATQRARIAVTRIIEQLQSACVAPKAAPVLEKSSGTVLNFIHSTGTQGSQVAPIPTKSEIKYSNGTLKEINTAGAGPYPTTYTATPTESVLATDVAPIPPAASIFAYYGSTNGTVGEISPGANGLEKTQAGGVIEVRVGLSASPGTTPISDAGAAASIRDSAILRPTPPSYNEKVTAPPCQ